MINKLSAHEFLTELRCLRRHLDPVLNPKMKNVLSEAERRLAGEEISTPEHTAFHKKQQGTRMTKEQILNKWLNKY